MRLETMTIPARDDRPMLVLPIAGIYKTEKITNNEERDIKNFLKTTLIYNVFSNFGIKQVNIKKVTDNVNGLDYVFVGPSCFDCSIYGVDDEIELYNTYKDLEFDDDFKEKAEKGETMPTEVIKSLVNSKDDNNLGLKQVVNSSPQFLKKYPLRAGTNLPVGYSMYVKNESGDEKTVYSFMLVAVPKERDLNSVIVVMATGTNNFEKTLKRAQDFVEYNKICNKTEYDTYEFCEKTSKQSDKEIVVALSAVAFLSEQFVQYKIG